MGFLSFILIAGIIDPVQRAQCSFLHQYSGGYRKGEPGQWFGSLLLHCWLNDRKDIWRMKNDYQLTSKVLCQNK